MSRRALLCNVAHSAAEDDAHPRHHVAPMDLALAAAILERAGWSVELWDTQVTRGADPARVAARVAAKAPELLLLRPLHGCEESTELMYRAAPDAARLLIGPNAPQLAARFLAESLVDGAFIGEPEQTLIELLPSLAEGRVPETLAGLQTRPDRAPAARPFIGDLDALPLPAHHHLVAQGYQFRYPLDVDGPLRMGYVLTSRGCALGCIFCAPLERESFGTKYRWRSADSVVDELEQLRDLGVNAVYFIDDFFAFSKPRIRDLCEAMLRRDVVLPWAAQVRAQGLDLPLLQLMRRAGCSTLAFGAESGSDRVLKVLKKGVTTSQIREQARLIHAAGIQLVGYFIIGTPSETDAERSATYRLIEEIRPEVAQVHIFNVFPGARAMDLFPELHDARSTKFTGPQHDNGRMARLDKERRAFYRRYYFSPSYLGRMLRRRWRPLLHNLGSEADFVRRSSRFFLGLGQ